MATTTVDQYREIVQNLIREYGELLQPSVGKIRTEVIMIPEIDHYAIIHAGHVRDRRIHGMVIHIDIIDGKVWIWHDGTSPGVALD